MDEPGFHQDATLLLPDEAASGLARLQSRPRKITKENKIKIEVGKTQYPLLRSVATVDLGWKVWTREQSKEQVNVYWVDTYVHDQMVRRLKPYQRVNHFPSSQHLGKKNLLTICLNRMKRFLPQEFAFFPDTFNFPTDIEQFQKFYRSHSDQFYIVKPTADSQGRGIYLTKQPDVLSKEEMVVQHYVDDPLLLDRCKFDLRLYVLVRSLSPLKIYLYEEGLSRLATCDYEKPNSSNQKNMWMHLTNYAINKTSPNFIFNKDGSEDHLGHKRSLSATMKLLQNLGCDCQQLQAQIDHIIVKTIVSAQPILLKKYREIREVKEEMESVCFEILGFDILIREDFTPLLLEVNHSPSFASETPLDLIIKKHLLLDTLNLLNLNPEDKIHYFKSRNQQDNIHCNQILRTYAKHLGRQVEGEEEGAFRKIYPLDSTHSDTNKTYERVVKASKQEKSFICKALPPPAPRGVPFSNQKIDKLTSEEIEKKGHSLSFYSVVSNIKKTKLKQLKQAIELRQLLPNNRQTFSSSPEQDLDIIQQEEILMYERKIRKDREKQKRKYILPMPVNSVNIRLDQRFSHRVKETKSNDGAHIQSNETQFKIHSMFNTATERRKIREDNCKIREEESKTARNGFREGLRDEDKFRITDRSNNFMGGNSYSIELKQKIERMQLARLRLQKIRKVDKASFMIIKSHSPQK